MIEPEKIDNLKRLKTLFAEHPRNWRENLYVYPVISRRAGGLSIGVNLNPDKVCNFDCVYCQVDRTVPPAVRKVDVPRLESELVHLAGIAVSGELFDDADFVQVPEAFRRFNDIAFSGDGEPTSSLHFPAAVSIAADVRRAFGLDEVKIVLITNAAYLHRPKVRKALTVMDANNGEIWAKLDAGTEEYYRLVNRSKVPLQTVLDNILEAARSRPIVIQSLWMNLHRQPPTEAEIEAFAHRIRDIRADGGVIRLVQVYTIARQTTEPWVTPLDLATLDNIAERIRAIADVPVATFGV